MAEGCGTQGHILLLFLTPSVTLDLGPVSLSLSLSLPLSLSLSLSSGSLFLMHQMTALAA